MKLIATLLIIASLIAGLISSLTVYVPTLDSINPADELTLNAPAGIDPDAADDPGRPPEPRVDPSQSDEDIVLDAELIEQLRDDGETRVRVREADLLRWDLNWLFGLSVIGLIAGAMMLRHQRAAEARAMAEISDTQTDGPSPRELLETAVRRLEDLRGEVAALTDTKDRLNVIIAQVGEVQNEQLLPFVEARGKLVNQLGMTGYAQLMDQFAAAERELNRSWSAAADEVVDESVQSLRTAVHRFREALAQLPDPAVQTPLTRDDPTPG